MPRLVRTWVDVSSAYEENQVRFSQELLLLVVIWVHRFVYNF